MNGSSSRIPIRFGFALVLILLLAPASCATKQKYYPWGSEGQATGASHNVTTRFLELLRFGVRNTTDKITFTWTVAGPIPKPPAHGFYAWAAYINDSSAGQYWVYAALRPQGWDVRARRIDAVPAFTLPQPASLVLLDDYRIRWEQVLHTFPAATGSVLKLTIQLTDLPGTAGAVAATASAYTWSQRGQCDYLVFVEISAPSRFKPKSCL